MNSTDSAPLTREYLQKLVKEGDLESMRPALDEFIQQVRRIVIDAAMNKSISVSWDIPYNLKRYRFVLYDMLRVNFPDCAITIQDRSDNLDTLDISWAPKTD
jgi:hypothetical protein